MITKELIDYVSSQRALGKKDDDIRQGLIAGGGWSTSDLEDIFSVQKHSYKKYFFALFSILLIATVGIYFYTQKDTLTQNNSKNVSESLVPKTQAPESSPSAVVILTDLSNSDFLKTEATLFEAYKKSTENLSVGSRCVQDQLKKVTEQQLKEIKDRGGDPLKDFMLPCLNQDLKIQQSYEVSLADGIASLNNEVSSIKEKDKADALSLISIWNQVLTMINTSRIPKIESDIQKVSKSFNDSYIYRTIYDSYPTFSLQTSKSLGSVFSQRTEIINAHTSVQEKNQQQSINQVKIYLNAIRSAEVIYEELSTNIETESDNCLTGAFAYSQVAQRIADVESMTKTKAICVSTKNSSGTEDKISYAVSIPLGVGGSLCMTNAQYLIVSGVAVKESGKIFCR